MNPEEITQRLELMKIGIATSMPHHCARTAAVPDQLQLAR